MKKVGHLFLVFLLILSTIVTSAGSAFAAPGDIQVNFSDGGPIGSFRIVDFDVPEAGEYTLTFNFQDPSVYSSLYIHDNFGGGFGSSIASPFNSITLNFPQAGNYEFDISLNSSEVDISEDTVTFTAQSQPTADLSFDPNPISFTGLYEGLYSQQSTIVTLGKDGDSDATISNITYSFGMGESSPFFSNLTQGRTIDAESANIQAGIYFEAGMPAGVYTDTMNFFVDGAPAGFIQLSATVLDTNTYFFYDFEGNELSSEIVIPGSSIEGAPAVPERTGYTSLGWFEEGASEPYDFSQIPDGDVYLYPQYQINLYDVYFDENGGSLIPNLLNTEYGSTLADNPIPTRTNYVFANWHTSPSLSDESIFPLDAPITMDMTLYASYTGAEFALTLDTGTGEPMSPLPIFYDETYPTPEDATKTGYTFDGWFDAPESDPEASPFDFGATVTGDTTAYAHFSPIEYTVTFEPENGEGSFTDTGFYDDYFFAPDSEPTRDNYSFMHWSTEPFGEAYDFAGTTVTGDLTLYAVWDPDDYSLFFNTQGGDPIEPMLIEYGEAFPELPTPTKTGYTFDGWFTGPEGSPTAEPFPDEEFVDGNETAYAHWTAIEYTLTFDSNGGTEVEAVTGDYDSTFPAPEANPTRVGYTFDYWYVEDENTPYDFDTLVTGDLTLTAKWTPLTYSVIYVENGGPNVSNGTVQHDQLVTPPEMSPWMGYTFEGWFLDDDTFEMEYDFTEPATGNLILYAKWTINEYTLTFDTGGFDEVPSDAALYQQTFDMPEGDPVRTGYSFGGWYTDDSFTTEYDFSTLVTGDRTVYALWIPDTFTVDFVTNSDTVIEPITGTYDQPIEAPEEPTKFGYEFAGWFTDSEFRMMYDFDSLITGDLTLYAKWDLAEFTLTFDTMGGSMVEPDTALYLETFTAPEPPTRTGYDFAGWYADSEFTTPFDFTAEVSADATAYAMWTPQQYMITFVENGGPNVTDVMGTFGEPIEAPPLQTWPGYVFDGWYTDSEFMNLYDFSTPVSGPMNLYAKWDLEVYTLTFNSMGGSEVEADQAEFMTMFEMPEPPIRFGYTFAGWYADEELTVEFDFMAPATANDMAYAAWTPLTYTVVFVENGGTDVADVTATHDQALAEPTAPTKVGHVFEGWFTDNGTFENEYDFETLVTGPFNLYAKWSLEEYTLTFDTGGFAEVAADTAFYQELFEQPADPTRTGYSFGGWYADAEFTTEFDFMAPATADATAYAMWVPNVQTVTFETNMGSEIAPVEVNYDAMLPEPEMPTREGFTFDGWYTDAEFMNEYDFSLPVQGDFTLYAKWLSQSTELEFNWMGEGSPFEYDADSATFLVPFNLTVGVWGSIVQPVEPVTSYEYFRADGTLVTDFTDMGDIYNMYVQNGDYVVVTAEDSNYTMTYYLQVEEAAMDDMYETDFETELMVDAEDGVLANDNLPLPYYVVPVEHEPSFGVMVTSYPENGSLEMNQDGSFMYTPDEGYSGDDTFMYRITYQTPYYTVGEASPSDVWIMPTAESNEAMVTITVNEEAKAPYVDGYADGTFRPSEAVTRQEIAVMMAKALTGDNVPAAGGSSYPDVTAAWAKDSVEYMRDLGVMTGMPDGTFMPNGNLTRAQLASMMDRYVNGYCAATDEFCDNMGMGDGYLDVPNTHWAYSSILRMQYYGTIIGYADGTYRPNQLVTRAQAVAVINRVVGLIPSESYDTPSFSDVPPTHWAYYDIERATRGY